MGNALIVLAAVAFAVAGLAFALAAGGALRSVWRKSKMGRYRG